MSIARDVVETYATWCADERRTPTHADEVRAVLHYATHDAYLPLHEAPQLPTATVGGFTLHVSHIEDGRAGGTADVMAPDGSTLRIVWDTAPDLFVHRVLPSEGATNSWGPFRVARPLPLTNDDEAKSYLSSLLPELETAWDQWQAARANRP